MRKLNSLLLLTGLLAFALSFSSCSGDDDEDTPPPTNFFSYDGESYDLSRGFIEDYGANGNGSFDFDIYLASSSIQYDNSIDEFAGTGNAIYLDLNTSSEEGLVNGTYTFSSTREAFSFTDGAFGININVNDEDGAVQIIGGTIEILVDGSTTTIDFDLTATGNKAMTGNFTGTLTEIQ